MTLPEAIRILNRERHRDITNWDDDGAYVFDGRFPENGDWLTPFEAIAIAQAYERRDLNKSPYAKLIDGIDAAARGEQGE